MRGFGVEDKDQAQGVRQTGIRVQGECCWLEVGRKPQVGEHKFIEIAIWKLRRVAEDNKRDIPDCCRIEDEAVGRVGGQWQSRDNQTTGTPGERKRPRQHGGAGAALN